MTRGLPRRRTLLVVAAVLVAASGTATHAQSAVASAGWTVVGEAIYEARDALTTWSGRAPLAIAELRFDPADPSRFEMSALVRPADFDSGNPLRDVNARLTVFDVADHPDASARAAADPATGPPRRAPDGWVVPIVVDLTLHGATVRYLAEARLAKDGAEWSGVVVLSVSLEEHGMRRPRLLGIVTEDSVRLEVRVRAHPAP